MPPSYFRILATFAKTRARIIVRRFNQREALARSICSDYKIRFDEVVERRCGLARTQRCETADVARGVRIEAVCKNRKPLEQALRAAIQQAVTPIDDAFGISFA